MPTVTSIRQAIRFKPMPTLTAINRFPVKSCRGEALAEATVESWGLAGDRRWMVVDAGGETITAREVNQMLLVQPEFTEVGLRVVAPGLTDLVLDCPTSGDPIPVTVHGKGLVALPASTEADAWFSETLGVEAHLVYLADPTCRPTNPAFSEPGDVVSFADGYPVHLITEQSLAALDELVAEGAQSPVDPLPAIRFRPNLVVSGAEPWSEDGWRRVRIGEAVFRVVKGCDRCVMTTLDPQTAARGKEPIRTLARKRRWDAKTWFGMNLIPDTPGAAIRLGDDVEVLESVPAPHGPPR